MGLGSLISTAYRGLVFVSYGFMNFTSTKRSREFGQQRVNSIPSQPFRDRIMVLTGANSGLGLETARQWYMGGGVCYMLCRSKERGEEAVQSILAMGNGQSSTGRLQLCVVDVSRPQQLADFIRQFRQSSKYIDVLVNHVLCARMCVINRYMCVYIR
jgi:dehydrogenase/reductase SDR family protein 12